jgi:hypothetical protein
VLTAVRIGHDAEQPYPLAVLFLRREEPDCTAHQMLQDARPA